MPLLLGRKPQTDPGIKVINALATLGVSPVSASGLCVCKTALSVSASPTSCLLSLPVSPLLHHGIVLCATREVTEWVKNTLPRVSMHNLVLLVSLASINHSVTPADQNLVGPLGRSPEGGRNWEGFSPDPVLSGICVAQTVKGIQDAGVIATTKHYILNEQEHYRSNDGPKDASRYAIHSTSCSDSRLSHIIT